MEKGKWQGSGAAAPETVLVEHKAPLLKRAAAVAVVLALAGVLLVWGIDLGQRIFGASRGAPAAQDQLALVQAELVRVTAERDALLEAASKAGLPIATGRTGSQPPSEDKVLPENQTQPGKAGPDSMSSH
ncbi:hypothetical protein LJR289_005944 [Pseudoduganella sp. LjRoot289]|uniref:hypothetical protein n=1 Tax=Pseudoduganella sp. LjRoot289 TaxID=3342314 RepID=UPI003ECE8EBA